MDFHEMDRAQLLEAVKTDPFHGLSAEEVRLRQDKHGFNVLAEAKKKSLLLSFFSQFTDLMIVVLLVAAAISSILGEWIDAAAIVLIVFLNASLGFYQDRKAEKSLEALKKLSAPQVQVLRSQQWARLPSREIVPGDVIRFSSGDRIGADVRLIEAASLEIEESALTGESMPAAKRTESLAIVDPNLADISNMAFMGTLVTRGSGVGVVVSTGMNTEVGQIAGLLQASEGMDTPLQRKLGQLGKILIIAALLLTLAVVAIGVLRGNDFYTIFFAGLSLAVAAVPEGLPAVVTIALSIGVQRMIKKDAVVRKLPAVEILGSASVICSDKTGTMTENEMTVTHLWSGGQEWTVEGTGYEPAGRFFEAGTPVEPKAVPALHQLLLYGMLCNNAKVFKKAHEYTIDGDPTEGSMVVAAMKAGITENWLMENFTVVHELPFDSVRKMMSVIVKDKNGQLIAVTKGAPDILATRCGSIQWGPQQLPLTAERAAEVQYAVIGMASNALRTMAIAYKPLPPETDIFTEQEIEKDLVFIGLEGMIDPPREEVKAAIQECWNAGIRTIMITGDHAATALAIAEKLHISGEDGITVEGRELDEMSAEELQEVVEKASVFARVTPEHKLRIVQALQQNGRVVAMTGDGVNDAPALKTADIGVAMGITGTDVAKEAASLILLDDNFATIKAAIVEGRTIYDNIRKFIRYLLASNVGEILVMLFAMILALPLPLVPIQILWVNLVTDGLPAMALGLDRPEADVMKKKPRDPAEGVFARGLGWKILSRGFLIGAATLAAFLFAFERNPADLTYAQTTAFATLVMAQLIHVFDCRSEKTIFARNPFGNKYLIGAVLSSLALLLAAIYLPPLQPFFRTVSLPAADWLLILGLAALPTFLLAGTFFFKPKAAKIEKS